MLKAKRGQKGPRSASRIPGPQRGRVIARRIAGQSERTIAVEEGLNRKTVGRILSQPDIENALKVATSGLHRLLNKAVNSVGANLDAHNERTTIALLTGLRVFQSKSQTQIEYTNPDQKELERRGLANRTLEELRYFTEHGYFPEEEEQFQGQRIGKPN